MGTRDAKPKAGVSETVTAVEGAEVQALCPGCSKPFVRGRADQKTCSDTCRQRVKRRKDRGDDYVVTDADRELIQRLKILVPIPVPLYTEEQIRHHILTTAVRSGEGRD